MTKTGVSPQGVESVVAVTAPQGLRSRVTAIVGFLALALLVAALPGANAAMEVDSSYRLGTGDRIQIRVFGEPDLSVETRIGDDGVIVYPFLGELQLAGMTVRELENTIVEGLRPDYLINPTVTVSLLEYRNFYIYGAVKSPGGYPFEPGISVRQAVAIAGGFTERASRNRILVIRDGERDGNEQPISLGDNVGPGDTITVRESFF